MNRKQRKERLKWLNVGQAAAAAENARLAEVQRLEIVATLAENARLAEVQRLEKLRRIKIQVRWNDRREIRRKRALNTPKTSLGEW